MTPAARAASLRAALGQPGNDRCADCRAPQPTWASYNIGVFLCQDCAGIHRSLGTHVSKVRSVTLDVWDQDAIDKMLSAGNRKINSTMEGLLKPHVKLSLDANSLTRGAYIRAKYIEKRFEKLLAAESKPADLFAGLNVLPRPQFNPKAPSPVNSQQSGLLTLGYCTELPTAQSDYSNSNHCPNMFSSFSFINSNVEKSTRNVRSNGTELISDDSLLSYGLFNFS